MFELNIGRCCMAFGINCWLEDVVSFRTSSRFGISHGW